MIAIEGNGSRPSHYGNGWSQGGAMYTLNSVEVHGVAYKVTSNDLSENDRSINGEQPSGELLRTGCLQRYVGDN